MTGIYLMILLTSLAIVTVSIHYYAIMTGALFLSFFMMQVGLGGGAGFGVRLKGLVAERQ